jgi:hypothetical protein
MNTLMKEGEPLTREAAEWVLWLLRELEGIRLVVGGEGHDNMAERVLWALKQARGERAH